MNKENELTKDELEILNHLVLLKEQYITKLDQDQRKSGLEIKSELIIYENQVIEYLLSFRKNHEK